MQPEPEEHGGELVIVDEQPATTLFHTNDPKVALARMAEISNEVVDVIEQQRFYVPIGGKKYVTCPGWKTAGGMLGLSPYTVWTKPNESQDGYIARVEIRTLDERTIAAAEAECARDESTWKSRPKHALRSMAETRATSRALRGPLEVVFALGGYEGTAAEEMPVDRDERPRREPEGKLPPEAQPSDEQITEIRELIDRLTELGPDTDWVARCREITGVSGNKLSRGGAGYLIDKLKVELADREDDAA